MQYPKDYYPTPESLIAKMVSKIDRLKESILEPSAGDGAILEYLKSSKYKYHGFNAMCAIEKDENLRSILTGKGIRVIDTDFLTFIGHDKFDLIIMNPPFSKGADHLLKAIEILYSGQIICLLNAETLKNPHTNKRRHLASELERLNADIEYIEGAFLEAERRAVVDIALIDIRVNRKVEDDLFDGLSKPKEKNIEVDTECKDVATKKTIKDLVAEYNQCMRIAQETLLNYYKNHRKIGEWIRIKTSKDDYSKGSTLTEKMQADMNNICQEMRASFWKKLIDVDMVRCRLTGNRFKEFYSNIEIVKSLDFTEYNCNQFILNTIRNFPKTIEEAVLEIFDMFTIRHAYHEELYTKNIHYFNGWRTNNAYKCNKKVIIPIRSSYAEPFQNWGKWSLDYEAKRQLNDIDLVMNYFDGMQSKYARMSDAISEAFETGQNKGIESTYFTVDCFKKGTAHLTFNDHDILRRFNIAACKGKGWLPRNYGVKPAKEIETQIVEEFEGRKNYKVENNVLQTANILRIAA